MPRARLALSFGAKLALDVRVAEEPPSDAQALVVAQDVNLILGDVEPVLDGSEAPEEGSAPAESFTPCRLGSLVVAERAGARPLFQAIVYDFDRSPPCRELHVFEALLTAFEEAKARGLHSLALRPVGTAHAGLPHEAFLRLLAQICYSSAELGTSLRSVHLLLPSPMELSRYEGMLKEMARTDHS